MNAQAVPIGKRGTIVIPANLRRRFGFDEGSIVITEEKENGLLIRPAVVNPVEIYSPEKKAYFLLSNTTDKEDYLEACKEVKKLGINPDDIKHEKAWI